jgi:acyl-ACP thioesterase
VETFRSEPEHGRVYAARRIVRSTDVTPSGRLRLDALARYLQTAAEDDLVDSGLDEPVAWIVRRCALAIRDLPAMGTRLTVRTFCSGTGPRWAERTTTLTGPEGPLVQATAVWAAVNLADGRPVTLSADFHRIYGPSAAGRSVSARLSHPRLPAGGSSPVSRPWPLRATDFDAAGHVNNTIHWAVVEDELAELRCVPAAAEVEYHRAILPDCTPSVVTERREGEVLIWLVEGLSSAGQTDAGRKAAEESPAGGRLLATARLSI